MFYDLKYFYLFFVAYIFLCSMCLENNFFDKLLFVLICPYNNITYIKKFIEYVYNLFIA